MPPGEVVFRVRERLRIRNERRIYQAKQYRHRSTCVDAMCRDLLDHSLTILPGARADCLSDLNRANPSAAQRWAEETLTRANRLLDGTWNLFDRQCDLSDTIEWHQDPDGSYQWTKEFYADLPLYDLPPGVDVKYVWELGRHQYLAELGRCFCLTGHLAAGVRAREILLSWIDDNPLYGGIHWTSALEVGMRVISWSWTLAFLARFPGWSDRDLTMICHSLEDHGEYLAGHLSLYSSPYNHLIGEATGLWLVAHLIPNSRHAESWKKIASNILMSHGPKQFHDDGFSVEQATSYHCYSLAFLAGAVNLSKPDINTKNLRETALAAIEVAECMEMPDGCLPKIGDADSARVFPILPQHEWDFRSLVAFFRATFDPDSCCKTTNPDQTSEEAYWLLGANDVGFSPVPGPGEVIQRKYETSGYIIRKSSKDYLLFDVGPIAHGLHSDGTPSTAHGHADQLQIIAWRDGKQLTRDTGMPFYGGNPQRRDAARSMAAHNTLELEPFAPVRQAGRLEWTHHCPLPNSTAFTVDGHDFLLARATWGACNVERHVAVASCGSIWVADFVVAPKSVRLDVNWQCTSEQTEVSAWSENGRISPEQIVAGDRTGWDFPSYGVLSPSVCKVFRLASSDRHHVLTALGPFDERVAIGHAGLQIESASEDREPSNMKPRDIGSFVWEFVSKSSPRTRLEYRLREVGALDPEIISSETQPNFWKVANRTRQHAGI